jgi:3-isopropylmalate dehydrogenase
MPATRALHVAALPGDGIGPEVVTEARKVVDAVTACHGAVVEWTEYDVGARRWHATGEALPDAILDELRGHDAILLGAVGDPSVPSGVLERGLLLRLRFELDHAVNLRPVRLYPGVASPLAGVTSDDVDIVVVRENTEGPYAGAGGSLRTQTPREVVTQESVNTWYGVERAVRDAFRRADERPRRRLTWVHKTNVLTHAGDLWRRVVDAVAPDYPGVSVDYAHADAAALYLVTDPARFDVVVTDNLFGDILTDLGAAIAGGMGLAASGNLDPSGVHPSMFEPVHGSAPDIAGTGTADPTAAVLSAALMLAHLGLGEAAAAVERAVAADLAERAGAGARTTAGVGDALAAAVAG